MNSVDMTKSDLDSSDTSCKTRRSHKKSRYGCEKCKARRIKCDEVKPKCSRCNKLGLACQYPKKETPGLKNSFEPIEAPVDLHFSQKSILSEIALSNLSFNLFVYDEEAAQISQPFALQALTPQDSALLEHYLDHTSKDMTVDDGDQYALQVGIPNLAFQSKPLMKSVLAFSAVCKCHDIIKRSPVSYADRGKIMDLLSTADRYHMESLREIQPTLSKVKHYDHILANAAMMGMYGSGSHCIRIWLTETANSNDIASRSFIPRSCQWISLFRAVRLAYGGLTKKRLGTTEEPGIEQISLSVDTPLSCEEQQKGHLGHPLYPILAATVSSAMTKLEEKVDEVTGDIIGTPTTEMGDYQNVSTDCTAIDLQACLSASELLRNIVQETFPAQFPESSTPGHSHGDFESEFHSESQFAMVSPWMRRYTASISSMAPSKLPRRFIVAFIHKAPTRYLELIEEAMSFVLNGEDIGDCGSPNFTQPEPDLVHQLAMEIFAHWLVLVLMLDNVWWIGGIGAWELKQIVTAKRGPRWRKSWKEEEDWWPEIMLGINRQLNKYREKT